MGYALALKAPIHTKFLSSPRSLTHPHNPHNSKEIIDKESLHDHPAPFAILENGDGENQSPFLNKVQHMVGLSYSFWILYL
jgi:hypothetical protein